MTDNTQKDNNHPCPLAESLSPPVDKGVSIPPLARKRTISTLPWAALEPGDSFFVPGKPPRSLSQAASHAAKRYNFKYTMRAEGTGTRVWRTK